MTGAAPSQPGVYCVLVRTVVSDAVAEPVAWNNTLTAAKVLAVDVPVLTVGGSVSGTVAQGQWNYVRLEASAGNTILLNLDAAAQWGATGLYVRYGSPPTLQTYDVRATVANSPDQELASSSSFRGHLLHRALRSLPAGSATRLR